MQIRKEPAYPSTIHLHEERFGSQLCARPQTLVCSRWRRNSRIICCGAPPAPCQSERPSIPTVLSQPSKPGMPHASSPFTTGHRRTHLQTPKTTEHSQRKSRTPLFLLRRFVRHANLLSALRPADCVSSSGDLVNGHGRQT